MPTTNRTPLNSFTPRFAAICGVLALMCFATACGDDDDDDAATPDASIRDGAVSDMSRPDSSATDGAIRDGEATLDGELPPFDMMMELEDASLVPRDGASTLGDGAASADGAVIRDGDIGEDGGDRDGSIATCDVGSCAPGYTCCYEDGSCVPLDCMDCCMAGDGGGPRTDLGTADDSGIGGDLDAGGGIGFYCGAIECAMGEVCCFSIGICVPAGCPECCGILPPPPPPGTPPF